MDRPRELSDESVNLRVSVLNELARIEGDADANLHEEKDDEKHHNDRNVGSTTAFLKEEKCSAEALSPVIATEQQRLLKEQRKLLNEMAGRSETLSEAVVTDQYQASLERKEDMKALKNGDEDEERQHNMNALEREAEEFEKMPLGSNDDENLISTLPSAEESVAPFPPAQTNPESRPGAFAIQGIGASAGDVPDELVDLPELEDFTPGQDVEAPTPDERPQDQDPDLPIRNLVDHANPLGLSVANLVPEEEDLELQRAQMIDSSPQKKRYQTRSQTRSICCYASLAANVLFVVLIVVLLSVLVPRLCSDDHDDHEIDPLPIVTAPPEPVMMTQEEHVLSLLPDYTVTSIQAVDEDLSPQRQAFQWTLQDPHLGNYSDSRIVQRFALATLYHSLGGPDWFEKGNWLSYDHHECAWWTIDGAHHSFFLDRALNATCPPDSSSSFLSQEEDGVSHLWINNNNLKGTIPEEISLLQSLVSIVMTKNHIHGTIPTSLYQLQHLEALFLDSNDFTGTIPSEMGLMPSIEHIWAIGNRKLGGTIPSEIGQLSTLRELLIDSCDLSGTIPTTMGNMSNLEFFWAWANPLVGPLPSELGRLDKLNRLGLWACDLSGTIPIELSNMKSMAELAFDDNPKMSGPIPSEIGLLTQMTTLHFANTGLTGTIPTELAQLEKLGSFFNFGNPLSGVLPTEIGLLKKLWRVWIHSTPLIGPIPSELGQLTEMKILNLAANLFSGAIPSELGSMTLLETLELANNFLSGTVPNHLGDIESLTVLTLSNNSLTGSISSNFCNFNAGVQEDDVLVDTLMDTFNDGIISVDCELVECTCDVCLCD